MAAVSQTTRPHRSACALRAGQTRGIGRILLLSAAVLVAACTAGDRAPETTASRSVVEVTPTTGAAASTTTATTTTSPRITSATLLAAGDIAWCGGSGDEATAALVQERPAATVATLGDHAYDDGTATEFAECYDPSWGQARARTRPSPGNHDYHSSGASGYFDYFGRSAGNRGEGWYSYDLGGWHVVVLNSICSAVGCRAGGAQESWLRADLTAADADCILAYWHHPRFSSGTVHGSDPVTTDLWATLDEFGADVVLSGHEHHYERFAPLTPDGTPTDDGIRQFVVGTGGRSLYRGFVDPPLAGSQVRDSSSHGVLALTLHPTGYDWSFVPVAGDTFTDDGSDSCR